MGLFKSNDTTLLSILEKINLGKIQLPDFLTKTWRNL